METNFKIEGMKEATEKVNYLVNKLEEARELASDLASTNIVINDKRQKDIIEHIKELSNEFKSQTNREPKGYYLVAEDECFEIRIQLNP